MSQKLTNSSTRMNTIERRAKRKTKENSDKLLLQKSRRLNELWAMEREIPLEPLPTPIQRGWKKGFKLRDDIARRRDANDLKRMLGFMNNFIYAKDQSFKAKKWHSKQMEDIPHGLRYVPELTWDKLGWPEHFKKWFVFEQRIHKSKYGASYNIKGYWFKYPWMFDTEVTPHMLTHYRPAVPNIAKEKAEIYEFMEQHNGWQRISHLKGYKSKWDHDPNKQELLTDIVIRETSKEFETDYLTKPDYDN